MREIDIADLLSLYGITDKAEREQLLSLASRANQPGWWHRYHDVLPPWFQAYIGLEESAQSIRSYDAQFVPGLLQTEEYAAAVLALGDFSLDEAERLVVLRKERQRHFAAGGTRLWAIVDEVALRRPVGGPAVLRRQLEYLGQVSQQPWLTLQITPFPTVSHAAPGSFCILRFADPALPDMDIDAILGNGGEAILSRMVAGLNDSNRSDAVAMIATELRRQFVAQGFCARAEPPAPSTTTRVPAPTVAPP